MPTPKRLKGQSPAHAHAPYQERALAKKLGGRVTPGSGNGAEKGDVRNFRFVRAECKCTAHDSFSVTRDILFKLDKLGMTTEEIPFMEIKLGIDSQGKHKAAFVVMPAWFIDIVKEKLNL